MGGSACVGAVLCGVCDLDADDSVNGLGERSAEETVERAVDAMTVVFEMSERNES